MRHRVARTSFAGVVFALVTVPYVTVVAEEPATEVPAKVRVEVRKKDAAPVPVTLQPLPEPSTAAPVAPVAPPAPAAAPIAPATVPGAPPAKAAVRKVFVRDFVDAAEIGDSKRLAFTTLAATAFARYPGYAVTTAADVKGVLATDALRQALGCDDPSCARSLGDALHAELMLLGTVSRTANETTLSLSLLELASARPLHKLQRPLPANLQAQPAIERLVEELHLRLQGRAPAELTIASDPAGATVTLDGQLLGETPLPALPVRAGIHEVVIQKAEFVAQKLTVLLADADVHTEFVKLEPVAPQVSVADVAVIAKDVAEKSAAAGAEAAAARVGSEVDAKLVQQQQAVDSKLVQQQAAVDDRLAQERAETERRLDAERLATQGRLDEQERKDAARSATYDQKATEARLAAEKANAEAERARKEAEAAQAMATANAADLKRKAEATKREMDAKAEAARAEAAKAASEAEAARAQAERTRIHAEQARKESQEKLERARREQDEAARRLEEENRRSAEELKKQTSSEVKRAREELREAVGIDEPKRTAGFTLRFQVAPQLDPALAPAQAGHRNGRELPATFGLDFRIPLFWQVAAVIDVDVWPSLFDFTAAPSGLDPSGTTRAPVGFTELHLGLALRGVLVGPLYIDLGAVAGPRWTRVALRGPTPGGVSFGYADVFAPTVGGFGGLGLQFGPWCIGAIARFTTPLGAEPDTGLVPGASGPTGFGRVLSFGIQTGLMF